MVILDACVLSKKSSLKRDSSHSKLCCLQNYLCKQPMATDCVLVGSQNNSFRWVKSAAGGESCEIRYDDIACSLWTVSTVPDDRSIRRDSPYLNNYFVLLFFQSMSNCFNNRCGELTTNLDTAQQVVHFYHLTCITFVFFSLLVPASLWISLSWEKHMGSLQTSWLILHCRPMCALH